MANYSAVNVGFEYYTYNWSLIYIGGTWSGYQWIAPLSNFTFLLNT